MPAATDPAVARSSSTAAHRRAGSRRRDNAASRARRSPSVNTTAYDLSRPVITLTKCSLARIVAPLSSV